MCQVGKVKSIVFEPVRGPSPALRHLQSRLLKAPKRTSETVVAKPPALHPQSNRDSSADSVEIKALLENYIRHPKFKRLVNQIVTAQAATGIKSIAILSLLPGEGKSFFTAALALAYAQFLDSQVLLLDTGSRSMSPLTPLFDDCQTITELNSSGPSLVEVRSAKDLIGDGIQDGDFYVGPYLESVKDQYDLVLLDTCSISKASQESIDPVVVAHQAEAAILVTSPASSRRTELVNIRDEFRRYNIQIIGTVHNAAGGNMKEGEIDLAEFLRLLKRNWKALIIIPILGAICGFVLAYKLPKKFKSVAVLNIQGSYFHTPFVGDLISSVPDTSELSSQRASLLRLALNSDFLDALGEEHEIFELDRSDLGRGYERELLLKRIEYFPINATTFQVSVVAPAPEIAKSMNDSVVAEMKNTLVRERYNALQHSHNAIQAHLEKLGPALESANTPSKLKVVETELQKVHDSLEDLLVRFSEAHPDVQKLRQKEKLLRQKLRIAKPATNTETKRDLPYAVAEISKQPSQEVFNDLIKKVSYLTVVLEMEKNKDNLNYIGVIEQPSFPSRPFFPSKSIFTGAGGCLGLILGALVVFFAELRRHSHLAAADSAALLEVPYLGELPALPAPAQSKFHHLISATPLLPPPESATRKQLAAPQMNN